MYYLNLFYSVVFYIIFARKSDAVNTAVRVIAWCSLRIVLSLNWVTTVPDILENLNEARETLGELWNKRKIKLDLSLELQCLEEDASKVSICEWVYPFEYTLLI